MGTEVCGKTLGVIGIGRIGSAVAKRAQAFEMNVIVFDPILTKLKAEALGVELVTLDELLERSDFITVHAPKSEKTANMIAMPQLNRMKPTARIINTARGGLVNEADLAQALKENLIAGAALDVYTAEPFEDNPFLGLENVVTTPHLAASTDEAQLSVAVEIAKQMVDYLTAGTIVNAVNVPSLDGATRKQLEPILYLAERLGRFQGLYMEGHPSSIRIEYAGDFGVADMYPVTTAILKGFFEPLVETVNEVSAPSLLEAHGIECSEKRRAAVLDYAFSIGVNVATDKESHHIVGTLFGKGDARICSIDGIRVDAKPEGCMLVCNNEDKPMIMAGITQLLGEAGINIANMTLGRTEPGGLALTVLNLDARPGEDLLDKVRQVPHVTQARLVAL
ncbi:MAG TPA: phosphoglycerate dehydrogenase [Candidatus Hydrogenedentes bacterium]|nr:phosphoglycerate dehydrogenase [Candidatus Hydrogenedentota bacterium]